MVFWVRIFWACRTFAGFIFFGLSCYRSILNDCLPSISLAVFQLKCLKPRKDVTIYKTFSIKMFGFVIDLSSRMAAFVKALSDS